MGDERQLFGLGLSHEHAVKRIVMMAGQATRGERMGHRDGECVKAIRGQGFREVIGSLELPEGLLDTDFPGRGGTHKDKRVGRANRCTGGSVQRRIIGEPPQQGVGVEQELQGASPRKAAARVSGSTSKSAAMRTLPRQ
jgi:hypothetical protein